MSFGGSLASPNHSASQFTPPSPPPQSNPTSEASLYANNHWAPSAHQTQLYLATLPTVTPAKDEGSSKSLQLGISRPKRKRITPEQLEVLSNLFEYTDTPTFDLREAIGFKLGMSNREVQVWFQNRRAKVNRQRIPANSQVLQERPLPSTSSQQQDPNPTCHRRMKSSPTYLLLPGVSSILNSDSCHATHPAPALLPPFQAALPGVDSPQDGTVHRSSSDRCPSGTGPPSPQDPPRSNDYFRSASQLRSSPPGSRRRISPSTPGSLYSRRWPRCRSSDPSAEDPAYPPSARRSSAEVPPCITSDKLAPRLATSHRNSSTSLSPWSLMDHSVSHNQPSYMSIGSMRLDPLSQPELPSSTNLPHGWAPISIEVAPHPNEKQGSNHPHQHLPHQPSPSISISTSRCSSSESNRFFQPPPHWQTHGNSAPSPTTVPLPRKAEDEREIPPDIVDRSQSLAPQASRPGLSEETVSSATRSLFASRCLPPLPNPFRPGPGSFPPPVALRVLPAKEDVYSANRTGASPNSTSEFKLPPLLNDRNADPNY